MPRYIEESEVKRMIIRRGWMSEEELENSSVVADLQSAQQIVRCKDCRWYDGDYCQKHGDDWGGDWYCADGERRGR